MDWSRDLLGLLAGFVLATVTTPVGVSGAVFLLPFQLSVLHVPNPRITPDEPAVQRHLRGPADWSAIGAAASSTAA